MQSKSPVMFLLASGGFYWFFVMVPVAGVEPARPKALDFESSTSANSITPAYFNASNIIHNSAGECKRTKIIILIKSYLMTGRGEIY